MRIGILSQWYDPEPGPASLPGVLARGLVARGHDVHVLTGFPNYPTGDIYPGYHQRARMTEMAGGVTIHRVPLYASHDASASHRFMNYGSFAASASAFGVPGLRGLDALWVYNSPATVALPMWFLHYSTRVPVVLHVMDIWPDSVFAAGFAPKGHIGLAFESMLNVWCRQMYRSSAYVAYISPSAGDELHRRGVPFDKLRYAPVCTDESIFHPSESNLRIELGIPDDHVVVMYAGAIGKAQGIESLADAVGRLPDDVGITLVVAGSGTSEALVEKAAREAPTKVRFIGRIPQKMMTPYMALGDIHYIGLAQDSLARFTMPSKIQATMACARPILLAGGGDPEQVVSEAGAGIIASPAVPGSTEAALLEAARLGRKGLAELGQKSRDYYEQAFSAEIGIRRVEELLISASAERV